MARWLRQSTQVCACVGPFIKASDGITAVVGADVASGGCRLKKNNANWVPAKSDVFTNEDGGGPFFEVALSAGDVDTLGLLRWTCYPSAAFSIFQVWEDFMVVDPVTYDAYFGTGPIHADVNVWNHTSVASHAAGVPVVDVLTWEHVSAASVVVSANVGQWRGTVVSAPTTSGSIPVDVVYWNHGSVVGIVTAGAPSINLVTWAGSPVSAMPGAPGAAGSVDIRSWGGKAVGAITTAGAIPVDVMYVNHTGSAGNAGLLSVNVLQWASAAITVPTTAGAIPVDVMYVNHTASAGNAGLLSVNVEQWVSAVVTAPTTAGAIPVDLIYINHSSAQGALNANVVSFTAGVQLPAVTSVVNIGSGAITATSFADAAIRQATLATSLLVSANVGSFTAGVQLPAVTSVVNIGSGALTATSFADAAIRQATLATTLLVSANVGSIGSGVLVSANVGQWRGTVPSLLSGTLVQSLAAQLSAGVINNSAIGNDAYSKIIFWTQGSAGVGSTTTQVSSNNIRSMTDLYKGSIIIFTTGTCNGAMRRITGQTGNVVTFAALPFEVSAGDEFGILATSWMEAPGGAAADVNVITWRGATPAVLNAGYVQSDVVMWAHSSASAMPGAPGAVAGSVDVSSWGGKAVGAITTAGAIPVDIMYVNHTASAGNAGLLSVNVLQWASAGVTAATTGAAIPVDVVYWNHGSVAGIVTAGAPSTRLVAISNVSAEGVLQANVASISTNVLVSANVAQWRGTVPNVLNVGNVMADLQMWAHSSASAMPGAPGGVVGSVNVNMWAGTSVAAVVTAGWPQVEVASYAAGEAPLQPTVAGRTLDISTGGEAGIDWANVGTQGATVNLAATTLGILGAASIGASSFAASAIDANALAASAVDEILDDTLEGSMTVRQALRIILSAVAGKLSGAAITNVLIRDIGDTKNLINATVDVAGDRTAITLYAT